MDLILDGGRSRSRRAAGGGLVLDRLKALARSILLRRRLDQDMDDEMLFHIEQYECDLIRSGTPPVEAARRARQAFGGISLKKEECRDVKGLPMFDELVRNVSYAFRQLRRSPGFAATVVLTLGLCIGVNTAVFSVLEAGFFRPFPSPGPERPFRVG